MLVLDELTYSYKDRDEPYRFSMAARPGEVTGVSGQSGSGKSTLLDLIAGFLVPESGSLTLAGKDLLALPPENRPLSILFQSETLFEHLSAGANIALGLAPATPKSLARPVIDKALAEVGLAGLAQQRAATMSGGQKQRVALARTLLRNRPVLLLDEPFSALDDVTRQNVRKLIGDLTRARNWTTVLVSHHADDLAALATRTYEIRDNVLFG